MNAPRKPAGAQVNSISFLQGRSFRKRLPLAHLSCKIAPGRQMRWGNTIIREAFFRGRKGIQVTKLDLFNRELHSLIPTVSENSFQLAMTVYAGADCQVQDQPGQAYLLERQFAWGWITKGTHPCNFNPGVAGFVYISFNRTVANKLRRRLPRSGTLKALLMASRQEKTLLIAPPSGQLIDAPMTLLLNKMLHTDSRLPGAAARIENLAFHILLLALERSARPNENVIPIMPFTGRYRQVEQDMLNLFRADDPYGAYKRVFKKVKRRLLHLLDALAA